MSEFRLTLGVCYLWFSNPIDEQNLLVAFLPGLFNAAAAPKLNPPNGALQTDASGKVIGDRYDGLIFPAGVLPSHDFPFGQRVQSNSRKDYRPSTESSRDTFGNES